MKNTMRNLFLTFLILVINNIYCQTDIKIFNIKDSISIDTNIINKYTKDSNLIDTVVVKIVVDREGNVISAEPYIRKCTTTDPNLLKTAIEAALKAKFSEDPTANSKQTGTITYKFIHTNKKE